MTSDEIEKLIVQEAAILSSPPTHMIGTGAAQRYAEDRLRKLVQAVRPEELTPVAWLKTHSDGERRRADLFPELDAWMRQEGGWSVTPLYMNKEQG